MTTETPALAARDLSVRFGSVDALDRVTFEVPSGATVALLGPNGSGKSTLFQAAVGLVDAVEGSIRLGSHRVAFVPQRLDVEPAFPVTALDVVRMGRYGDLGWLRRFGERDHALVADAVALLGIEALADRRFGDLSGGERQRVLLAQAAAQDARILLLDEPFTGVDRPTADAVRSLLGRWGDEGRTVIVATHDLESGDPRLRPGALPQPPPRRLRAPATTCTESVLAETFAGRVVRVGDLLVDVAHHHDGAG